MNKEPNRIASFSVDHDFIKEGFYISRIDGDITTYDMRTRVPNSGDYMDNLTMHSLEHMFATLIRSSRIGANVIYFGPMGCQTGFYLLVRNARDGEVLDTVKETLAQIAEYSGDMYGSTRKECGNYLNLSVEAARGEAARYLSKLNARECDFAYPQMPEIEAKVDIGIIGAMDSEVEGLVALIDGKREEVRGSVRFYLGRLFGKRVAITRCGVGKVFAAIAAEAMIISYAPDLIINTGVGGAITEGLHTADVVIADKLVQHDMDTSLLGDPKGLVSGINKIYFEADARAVSLLADIAREKEIAARVGTVATGDRFVAEREEKARIAAEFSASACEMEGGAIAHAATVSSTPFAVIRAISDSADGEATMDYPTFMPIAAKISTELTLELIKEY